MRSCEQQTATEPLNLIYFPQKVSSDHTEFVMEFEQDGLKKLITCFIIKVQVKLNNKTIQINSVRFRNIHNSQIIRIIEGVRL